MRYPEVVARVNTRTLSAAVSRHELWARTVCERARDCQREKEVGRGAGMEGKRNSILCEQNPVKPDMLFHSAAEYGYRSTQHAISL